MQSKRRGADRMAALLLTALVTHVGVAALPVRAEVTRVSLRVDGLACPFCAYGLEKKIRRWDAVEKYHIELKTGLVHVYAKSQKTLQLARFANVVKSAGFTHGDGTLAVSGRLTRDGGAWLLQAAERQTFVLPSVPGALQQVTDTVAIEAAFSGDQLTTARPRLTDVRGPRLKTP